MKKLNRKFIKGTNWALAGLLSLFGMVSCNEDDPNGGGLILEYGTPYAGFRVSGKVTDADGKSLQGVRVVVPRVDHCQRRRDGFIPDEPVIPRELHDTLYTHANGTFTYDYGGFPSDTVRLYMKFEDTSSPTVYNSDSTTVDFLQKDLKGKEGWNNGQAEKKISIKLNRKK